MPSPMAGSPVALGVGGPRARIRQKRPLILAALQAFIEPLAAAS